MYKYIILFALFTYNLYSQPFKFGCNGEAGIMHTNQEYLLGTEINLLYQFNKNIEIGSSLGTSLTSLEGKLGNYSGFIVDAGLLLNYYPFLGRTTPFVSGGVLYNLNLVTSSGNNPLGSSELQNAFGYVIKLGLQNELKKKLRLNIGLEYKYQNPSFSFESNNTEAANNFESNYEISSLSLFIALIFDL